ncbi:hypothetical protein GQ457_01G037670 [Hibiscus cannabinus]
MDIEPLWTLGGWFLLSFFDCMALSYTYQKPHFPFLLLLLPLLFLFLFLLLLNPSANPIGSSPAIPFKRLLLHSSSTMDFNSRQRASSSESSGREFGTQAHEVPSGPNPISNSAWISFHSFPLELVLKPYRGRKLRKESGLLGQNGRSTCRKNRVTRQLGLYFCLPATHGIQEIHDFIIITISTILVAFIYIC